MTDLIARNLNVESNQITLLRDGSFCLKQGELVCLLGPNGAGKTTLLRTALGLNEATSGSAFLGDADCASLTSMERARSIAYLPQQRPLAWPNTVKDVIALGRFAYGAAPGRLQAEDAAAVDRAIELCSLQGLSHRSMDTLSGGELARVHCARAFAAETPLLVADEPVAALDPLHQFRIMDIIQSYVARGGGALVVLHDIALAARYASRLIWMKAGEIVADGPVADTLTEARLAEIYNVRAQVNGASVEIEGPLN